MCESSRSVLARASYMITAPGRSVPLRRGARVRIGRHPQNELVLDDSSVSRFHTRIEWPESEAAPVALDLGSTNGTLLDGVRVQRAPLSELSRLTLGDVHLTVLLAHPSIIASTGMTLVRLFDEACPDASGRLRAGVGLRDLLLQLERARRTVSFRLSADGFEAQVTFARGKIVEAQAAGVHGCGALLALLSHRAGGHYVITGEVELHEVSGGALPAVREIMARLERLASGTARPLGGDETSSTRDGNGGWRAPSGESAP